MGNIFDVIIIGAGPIGLACAIEAEKRNLSYIVLEKGCIVNSIFNYPINMTFFSTSDRLEIGGVPFISHGDKPTRREALEYYRRVAGTWNLKIKTYEKVNNISSDNDIFNIETTKDLYTAKRIIICTGYFDQPNLINIPGEDLPHVKHYFDEPHPYAFKKVVIAGGGNSAVDTALETFRKGASITMVIRESQFKESIKYWVRPDIENRIKEGSIKAYFNSIITEITEDKVKLSTPDGIIELEAEFVFLMTGYQTDYTFLQSIGIQISPDKSQTPCYNSKNFETNVKNLYLAGVVCGGLDPGKWFIENSREHAIRIFDSIQAEN